MAGVRAIDYFTKGFPSIAGVKWFNLSVLVITPALSLYGLFRVPILSKSVVWSAVYYIFSMVGITAGYHRLWSHRSYVASYPLRLRAPREITERDL
ncbi:hypothetical protein L210DRAFT_3762346 [Boletus edulis BED1]|uniref:Uncharacterized protein n=1 Tax=Boletus edulis BED1 TaxID=1328754 RepID=A0AAD4GC21_BOLED|nr:hypothetical protein L210DRAFT_3762346 [Boletus edulis BED1]